MANGVYNRGKQLMMKGLDLETANLYVLLVKDDYTFNANNNHISDLVANQITVEGYAHGGAALTSLAVVEDDTNGFAFLFAANLTFEQLAAGQNVGGAVLYVSTGVNTTSQVVSFYDVTNTPTNGGDISINWAANSSGAVLRLA